MPSFLQQYSNIAAGNLGGRIVGIYFLLIAANLAAWVWALITFRHFPLLLGTAFLAYGFGLRHAVDADHIAAIDNVTRKLMQEGKRPVAAGLFFSLGHSTIVIMATAIAFKDQIESFHSICGFVGTLVSASFMLAIAIINLIILAGVYRTFQHVKAGGRYVDEDLNMMLAQRGFVAKSVRPLFRIISQSWDMYPLGFLFGLGFDTATEVGLLGISAAEASKELSVWSILVFPALFTVGMSLIDTTDSVLLLGAYGWAFVKPIRKLYYNMTITFVSVIVALVDGGIEVLGLIGGTLRIDGPFWGMIASLNDNFGVIGYVIIGIFVLCWIVSFMIYRAKRYDEMEVRMTAQ
jgi:nickel/cobalt transporter (NiCoT) family protein